MKQTWAEQAAHYGIDEAIYRREAVNYLQSEGYDDSGNEYATLDDWLRRPRGPLVEWNDRDRTPWQKGDDSEY